MMAIKKLLGKKGLSLLLAFTMLTATVVPHLDGFQKLLGNVTYAADSTIAVGDKADTLQFNLTWLNNSGAYRLAHGIFYLPNKFRKEFFIGDTSDPKWGKFANKYVFCIANHTKWPTIFSTPVVHYVWDGTDTGRPPAMEESGYDFQGAPISKFNFIFAALAMYYMNTPSSEAELYDKYEGTADYIIAKTAASIAFEGGALHGPEDAVEGWGCPLKDGKGWSYDQMVLNSNAVEIYGRDFNPDSTGSTRVWDELTAEVSKPSELGGGTCTYSYAKFWEIWKAASTLDRFDYDADGFYKTPIVDASMGSDGKYHAKVSFTNLGLDADFFPDLEASTLYGDWTYDGVKSGDDGIYLDFVSPTGTIPEEQKIADLKLRPGSSYENLNTDFTQAQIIQFYFPQADGSLSGQDMLCATFEGELSIGIRWGTSSSGSSTPVETNSHVSVKRYEHTETWKATYNVNLIKFDSETGKPLENSMWDILEAFDDSQLDTSVTALDRTPDQPGAYSSALGSLTGTEWGDDAIEDNYSGDTGLTDVDANKYNWANDDGSQFERWDGWDESGNNEVCTRDNDITGSDGYLYTNSTDGSPSSTRAHTDVKSYTYHKGYCGGHPAPEIEYEELTGEDPPDSEIEEANQAEHDKAWAEWYAEVEKCEKLAAEGGFFHAIEPGVAQAAMEADRDEFYKDFISLTYDYSAKETTAREGYILHGTHTDDIPIETRTVTSYSYNTISLFCRLIHVKNLSKQLVIDIKTIS